MKKFRPWIQWTIWIVSLVSILLFLTIGYLYYKIHSIQVEDVLKRHATVSKDLVGEQQGGGEDSNKTNSKNLPSFISSPVDKANEFASKPIQSQDALDAAAILLKSGLSLKEVYYLTGQASDKLSNNEKQKIRDLLLSKLTKEEIESLRAITTPYGKELKILDPSYPIELIGVYDPEERKKVLNELQDKENSLKSQQVQQQNNKQENVEHADEEQLPNQVQPSSTPSGQKSDPTLIVAYTSKLDSLKTSCQGNINNLVSGVVSAKKGNKDLGLKELQSMFVQKFVDAESKCDTSFNGILSDAGNAGISSGEIDGWKQSYYSMKQAAQGSAIGQIEKALSNE